MCARARFPLFIVRVFWFHLQIIDLIFGISFNLLAFSRNVARSICSIHGWWWRGVFAYREFTFILIENWIYCSGLRIEKLISILTQTGHTGIPKSKRTHLYDNNDKLNVMYVFDGLACVLVAQKIGNVNKYGGCRTMILHNWYYYAHQLSMEETEHLAIDSNSVDGGRLAFFVHIITMFKGGLWGRSVLLELSSH